LRLYVDRDRCKREEDFFTFYRTKIGGNLFAAEDADVQQAKEARRRPDKRG